MTRIQQIKYLLGKGEKIEYHYTAQKRLMVDSIMLDGKLITFNTSHTDQAEAGSWILLLWWDWIHNGG